MTTMLRLPATIRSIQKGTPLKLVLTSIRRCCAPLLALGALVLLQACSPVGTLISTVNQQSNERAVERSNQLRAKHLDKVQNMRDRNDPMGDYLWVRANADMMIPNPISDPLVLKKMYEDAAAKGSLDAQHVLGRMLISGSSTPSGFCTKCPALAPEDRNPKLGLEILEKAIQKRCFFWSVEIDGMANRQCLVPISNAGYVWPKLRDGTVFSKDLNEASRWKAMDDSCTALLKKAHFDSTPQFPVCN